MSLPSAPPAPTRGLFDGLRREIEGEMRAFHESLAHMRVEARRESAAVAGLLETMTRRDQTIKARIEQLQSQLEDDIRRIRSLEIGLGKANEAVRSLAARGGAAEAHVGRAGG